MNFRVTWGPDYDAMGTCGKLEIKRFGITGYYRKIAAAPAIATAIGRCVLEASAACLYGVRKGRQQS